MASLFALIGNQGLNSLLGLPRLESLFSVSASSLALVFTVLGAGFGLLIGTLISAGPLAAGQWPQSPADDLYPRR